MTCKGCGEKGNPTVFDRRGNQTAVTPPSPSVSKKELVDGILSYDGSPAAEKTINQLIEDKEKAREHIASLTEDFVGSIGLDMKRMVIIELISVYNHEDISMTRISPTQALATLWKHLHSPYFTGLLGEFPGLIEEVDIKYEELMKKRIKSTWLRR
jgi:hypothetical protein